MACCKKYKALIFKICALYFKIYGLYFLLFQIFEKQRLIKGEKCSLFRAVLASFLVRLRRF